MPRKRTARPVSTLSLVVLLVIILAAAVIQKLNESNSTTSGLEQPTSPPVVVAPSSVPSSGAPTPAQVIGNYNLLLGNPSDAVHDPGQSNNYLIERPQYTLSYNRDRATPNWVSWQLTQDNFGPAQRSNDFSPDTTLPSGWLQVQTDFYTGSGYDRGHMCPSADRTKNDDDNAATFIMTNIVPQSPANNRGTWEHLESDSRTWVKNGHVLYIVAGVEGSTGVINVFGKDKVTTIGSITIPEFTWKVVVVLPKGDSRIESISANAPVLAVRIPNNKAIALKDDWKVYQVTVNEIEAQTGYHFFGNLPPAVQTALKSRIDPPPSN